MNRIYLANGEYVPISIKEHFTNDTDYTNEDYENTVMQPSMPSTQSSMPSTQQPSMPSTQQPSMPSTQSSMPSMPSTQQPYVSSTQPNKQKTTLCGGIKYFDTDISISQDCMDELWDKMGCVETKPENVSEYSKLTFKEVQQRLDMIASTNNNIYRKRCYGGDTTSYPAVRLYISDKEKPTGISAMNYSIGKYGTGGLKIHKIVISPNYKIILHNTSNYTGENRQFVYDVENLDDFKMQDTISSWSTNTLAIDIKEIPNISFPNDCVDYIDDNNDILRSRKCIDKLWKSAGCIADFVPSEELSYDDFKEDVMEFNETIDENKLKSCYGSDKNQWPKNRVNKEDLKPPVFENYLLLQDYNSNNTKCKSTNKPLITDNITTEDCKYSCDTDESCTGFNMIKNKSNTFSCSKFSQPVTSVYNKNAFGCQMKLTDKLKQNIPLYVGQRIQSKNGCYAEFNIKGNLIVNKTVNVSSKNDLYSFGINSSASKPYKLTINNKGQLNILNINNFALKTITTNVENTVGPYSLLIDDDCELYILDANDKKITSSVSDFKKKMK